MAQWPVQAGHPLCIRTVEPCADVSRSAAARRVIVTGGSGGGTAPIDFGRRRRQLKIGRSELMGGVEVKEVDDFGTNRKRICEFLY